MSNIDKLHEIERLRFKISKQKELIDYYGTMSRSLGGGKFVKKCSVDFTYYVKLCIDCV